MKYRLDVLDNSSANSAWDNFCDYVESKYDYESDDYGEKFDQELAVYGGENIVDTVFAEFDSEQQAMFWLLKWA